MEDKGLPGMFESSSDVKKDGSIVGVLGTFRSDVENYLVDTDFKRNFFIVLKIPR